MAVFCLFQDIFLPIFTELLHLPVLNEPTLAVQRLLPILHQHEAAVWDGIELSPEAMRKGDVLKQPLSVQPGIYLWFLELQRRL